jgi:hypothetical protein
MRSGDAPAMSIVAEDRTLLGIVPECPRRSNADKIQGEHNESASLCETEQGNAQ